MAAEMVDTEVRMAVVPADLREPRGLRAKDWEGEEMEGEEMEVVEMAEEKEVGETGKEAAGMVE